MSMSLELSDSRITVFCISRHPSRRHEEHKLLRCGQVENGAKPCCPHHEGCPSCKVLAQGFITEEQAVVRRMQESLRLEDGRITISYPWILHLLKQMQSNRGQVEPVQERIRQGLSKKGWLNDYNKEIKKQ